MTLSESICNPLISIIQSNLDAILALRDTRRLKQDQSYVSDGDLLCEQLIINYFRKFGENTLVVSEESCKVDFVDAAEGSMIVTLDPIDGTENFVSGLKEWGIGISVYKGMHHFESLIALPELNEYLITGEKTAKYNSRISGISSSLTKEDLQRLEEGFEYRIIGCSMYNMFNVIRGSFNSFENPKGAYSWDILPGLNLALEHKLDVTVENKPYNGEFLQPNTKYRFRICNI